MLRTRGVGWGGGMGWDVNVHVNLQGGKLTFLCTCRSSWRYAHAGWGGGMGWDVNVHVNLQGGKLTFMWTCRSSWRYAHAGWGWGGGVGWDVNVHVNLQGGKLTFMMDIYIYIIYWIGDKDPWKTQGEVLKAVRDLQLLWQEKTRTGLTCFWERSSNTVFMFILMLMMMIWWWWWWWWWWP